MGKNSKRRRSKKAKSPHRQLQNSRRPSNNLSTTAEAASTPAIHHPPPPPPPPLPLPPPPSQRMLSFVGSGWKPGYGESSRSQERTARNDAHRLKRAQLRGQLKAYKKAVANPTEVGLILEEHRESTIFSRKFLVDFLFNLDYSFSDVITKMKEDYDDTKKLDQVDATATFILEECEHKREKYGVSKEDCITHCIMEHEGTALVYRACSRLYSSINNPEGALEDLTEALLIIYFMTEKEEYTLFGHSQTMRLLYQRSQCYIQIGKLDLVIEDLWACCSAARAFKKEWEEDEEMIYISYDSVSLLLSVMAEQKRLEYSAGRLQRPFLSQNERDKIERRLGLNSFDKDNYLCLTCKKRSSDECCLLRCTRCRYAWFCSKECQRKAIGEGIHNCGTSCKKPKGMGFFSDDNRDSYDQEFEANGGWLSLWNPQGQPTSFLRDLETNRYFNFLTDATFFFLPSEEDLVSHLIDDSKGGAARDHYWNRNRLSRGR